MPTANETSLVEFQGLTVRFRPPSETPHRGMIVLLHGWTGNEDVMWVFAHHLTRHAWLISPRGTLPADSGYGWTSNRLGIETPIDAFIPASIALDRLIDGWRTEHHLEHTPLNLVGFSQGAALAFSYALMHAGKANRLAGLAGFLPSGAQRFMLNKPMDGTQIYIAHGTRDETVPIQAAELAARGLEEGGATVTYCASDMGHKLSSGCLRGLEEFLNAPG